MDTNDIKDLFCQEYVDGKKPTVKEFAYKYADIIDVEEFIDFGMAFAMIHCDRGFSEYVRSKI